MGPVGCLTVVLAHIVDTGIALFMCAPRPAYFLHIHSPFTSLQSTLMRAIANGQLEGFPPKEVLRTVYVEHDIDASEAETPVVEFVFGDKNLQVRGIGSGNLFGSLVTCRRGAAWGAVCWPDLLAGSPVLILPL